VFQEADSVSVCNSVRAVWELDKNNAREVFKDQKSNSELLTLVM